MANVTNKIVLEDILEQSGTTEGPVTHRTEEIITPPARENTCVDDDFIDELDELFGVSLDDENAELLKNLTIDDVPLDGKSPDMSSESERHDSDYEGLLTERSEYIAELEKVASQSDAGCDVNVREPIETVEDGVESGIREEADEEDIGDPPGVGELGYTTKTCSELQLSTWHSSLVSDCDTATMSATTSEATSEVTSEGTVRSEPQPRCDERMSSGKKSAVKFYEEEEDNKSVDAESSR